MTNDRVLLIFGGTHLFIYNANIMLYAVLNSCAPDGKTFAVKPCVLAASSTASTAAPMQAAACCITSAAVMSTSCHAGCTAATQVRTRPASSACALPHYVWYTRKWLAKGGSFHSTCRAVMRLQKSEVFMYAPGRIMTRAQASASQPGMSSGQLRVYACAIFCTACVAV